MEASLSPTSDFYDAGGHSLLLAKLAKTLAEEAGVSVSIPEIIEHPTLGRMAKLLEDAKGDASDFPTVLDLSSTDLSTVGDNDPIVLKNGAGITVAPSAAPVAAVKAKAANMNKEGERQTTGAVRGVAKIVDLAAEAKRLDPSIYPAGTRKAG